MKEMIVVILVIIGIVISAIYTYIFQNFYKARYGRRGLSYILAGALAIGIIWFSLEYEVPSGWEYKVSLAIIIISAILNIVWIIKEMFKAEVDLGNKINVLFSQILLVLGIVGIIFVSLLALYAMGGGGKRKKK